MSPDRRREALFRLGKSVYDGHAAAHAWVSAMRRFPGSEDDFLALSKKIHEIIFQEAFPTFAGRFRRTGEEVQFGGDCRNRLRGASPERIEPGLRRVFHLAVADLADGDASSKTGIALTAAKFLERFFRIHPFKDGNGRVARLLVKLLCESNGRVRVRGVNRTTRARRRYVHALEYAHRHAAESDHTGRNPGANPFVYLARWVADHLAEVSAEDEMEVEQGFFPREVQDA